MELEDVLTKNTDIIRESMRHGDYAQACIAYWETETNRRNKRGIIILGSPKRTIFPLREISSDEMRTE